MEVTSLTSRDSCPPTRSSGSCGRCCRPSSTCTRATCGAHTGLACMAAGAYMCGWCRHRDIKSANIMLEQRAGVRIIKVGCRLEHPTTTRSPTDVHVVWRFNMANSAFATARKTLDSHHLQIGDFGSARSGYSSAIPARGSRQMVHNDSFAREADEDMHDVQTRTHSKNRRDLQCTNYATPCHRAMHTHTHRALCHTTCYTRCTLLLPLLLPLHSAEPL